MNKKIFIIGFVILMLSSMTVIAIGKNDIALEKTIVTGLENAQLRVKNVEIKFHLEEVLNNIQEKSRERLNNLTNLVFEEDEDGNVIVTGKREAKFLGLLKFQKNHRFQVNEGGEVKLKKTIWDRFWQMDEVE